MIGGLSWWPFLPATSAVATTLHNKFAKRRRKLLAKMGQKCLSELPETAGPCDNSQECEKAQHESNAKQRRTVTTHSIRTVLKLKSVIPNLTQVRDWCLTSLARVLIPHVDPPNRLQVRPSITCSHVTMTGLFWRESLSPRCLRLRFAHQPRRLFCTNSHADVPRSFGCSAIPTQG